MKNLLLSLSIALTALPFSLFSQYNQCERIKFGSGIAHSPVSRSHYVKKWAIELSHAERENDVIPPLIQGPGYYWNYPNRTRHNDQVRSLITSQTTTSSLETAIKWHRDNSKAKFDYSMFVYLAYSMLHDPNLVMQSQQNIPRNP